jgi:hypothetical protein
MATEAKEEAGVTKEQLEILRDGELLSWAKVAERLELGSPGAARRVYSKLVRPHTESVLPGKAKASAQPVDLTTANLSQLQEQLAGRTIVVQRKGDHQESIPVAKVTSVKNGNISFNDGAKTRTVKAAAVVALR